MSPRHDGDDPRVDDDPTGVRALLSALPDPGPMPPELVERITASLAAERAAGRTGDASRLVGDELAGVSGARSTRSAGGPVPASSGAPVVDPAVGVDELAVHRDRRRGPSLRSLGWVAAAAVLGIVVLGSLPLVNGQATWSALFTGSGDASSASSSAASHADSGAGAQAGGSTAGDSYPSAPAATPTHGGTVRGGPMVTSGSTSAAPSEPTEGGAEAPGQGSAASVTVYQSGHAYTARTLGADAASLGGDQGVLHPLDAESPGIGPIGTAKGAWACATALGVPADARLVVDVATFAGKPAAVVRAQTSTGTVAYAVKRSCTTGAPGLLAGPSIVG